MYKKKLGLYLILMLILVMVAAVPAFAQANSNNGKESVGVKINLFEGDQTVSGSFHVNSGHYAYPEIRAFGKTDFVLEIDGVKQEGRFISSHTDGVLYHTRLYNFPEGLPPGEYIFTGTWYDPCYMFSDECEKDTALADPPYVVEITVTVLP
jgi:hypothetical protein